MDSVDIATIKELRDDELDRFVDAALSAKMPVLILYTALDRLAEIAHTPNWPALTDELEATEPR